MTFQDIGQAAPLKTTGRRAASWGVYGKTADCPLTAESQGRLPEKPTLGSQPTTPTNRDLIEGDGAGAWLQ